MKRTGLMLCIAITLSMSITGCWSRRELNSLAIAVGLGIDKAGEQFKVSVQVVEPGEVSGKSGSNMAPVTFYQATGDTIFEALRKMTKVSPRKIYVAHLRIVVLGESLAREGISEPLEFLSRDPETRNDFFIIVAKKSTAEDTLRILTNLEKVPAVRLFTSLEASEKQWAPTTVVKLDDLINDLTNEGKHPVLSGLKISGDVAVGETIENLQTVKSPTELQYSGLAVFNKEQLIGWLTTEEGKGYNYITNHVSSAADSVKCPSGGRIAFEVIRSDTKIKGSIHNELPRIDIEVLTKANIAEVQCRLDLTKTETIAQVEKWAAQNEEELIERTIARVQEDYKVDIFGFGKIIHHSNPKAWRTLKKNWDQTFENLSVNIKVIYKIDHLGKVSNSFQDKME